MLSFQKQTEFERWLRACPLGTRGLTYSVTRSADDGVLSVGCTWRTLACVEPASRACVETALPSEPHIAPRSATPPADGEAACEGAAEAAEAERLREQLARMRSFVAGQGAPAGEYAKGQQALAAMMRAREAGASTREQVRACLGAGLGAEYPSPPGYDPRPPTEGETGSHGEGEVHEAAVSSDA